VTANSGDELLASGLELLRGLVADVDIRVAHGSASRRDDGTDDIWRIEAGPVSCDLLVALSLRPTPRTVDNLAGGLSRGPTSGRDRPVLVVAPWLSPRSQDLLRERGFNYLDLTGNARLRIPRPTVFIRTEGARQNPVPPPQPRRGLTGKLVNALVRLLVDATPPYRMSELARVSGTSLAYVSLPPLCSVLR